MSPILHYELVPQPFPSPPPNFKDDVVFQVFSSFVTVCFCWIRTIIFESTSHKALKLYFARVPNASKRQRINKWAFDLHIFTYVKRLFCVSFLNAAYTHTLSNVATAKPYLGLISFSLVTSLIIKILDI